MLRFIGGRGSSLRRSRPLTEDARGHASCSRTSAGRVCWSKNKALNYNKDYYDYEKGLGVLSAFSRGLFLKPFLFFSSLHCFFFLIITIVFHYVPVRACCKGIGDWKRHTSSGNDHLGGTVISVALRKLVNPLSSFIVLLVCFSDFTIFTPEEYDNMQNKSAPRLTQPAASSFPERTLSLPGILQLIPLVLPVISVMIFHLFMHMLDQGPVFNAFKIVSSLIISYVWQAKHLLSLPVVS